MRQVGRWPFRSSWGELVRRVAGATRRDDAEDLLQSAWIRMRGRKETAESVIDPSAFLVQTAINLGMDEYRRSRRSAEILTDVDYSNLCDLSPLQDEVFVARERLLQVEAALSRLGPRTKAVFLMHRLDGLKYREIAARLEISQSAVEKHIARAVVFLAQNVGPE